LVPVLARLLARGARVTLDQVAAAGGRTPEPVAQAPDRHPTPHTF
jgi:hypothetical protein